MHGESGVERREDGRRVSEGFHILLELADCLKDLLLLLKVLWLRGDLKLPVKRTYQIPRLAPVRFQFVKQIPDNFRRSGAGLAISLISSWLVFKNPVTALVVFSMLIASASVLPRILHWPP